MFYQSAAPVALVTHPYVATRSRTLRKRPTKTCAPGLTFVVARSQAIDRPVDTFKARF